MKFRCLWLVVPLLFSGCASPDGVLSSHLTRAEVKQIATARLQESHITLSPAASWKMSLAAEGNPPLWTVMPQEPNSGPVGYWLLVEDRPGGKADFVSPQMGLVKPPTGSDWLKSVQSTLHQVTFPIELEALLGKLHLEGTSMNSGGSLPDGRMYLEGTLHQVKEGTPERFALRCYITMPDGWTGRKIVISAELSYIDSLVNRYLLTDGNQ